MLFITVVNLLAKMGLFRTILMTEIRGEYKLAIKSKIFFIRKMFKYLNYLILTSKYVGIFLSVRY